MKHLLIALFVVFLTITPALAGGLLFQGDDQKVGVKNAAGSHSSYLNPDGTLSLDAYTLTPTTIPTLETDLDSVEAVLGTQSTNLGSIENALDQIRSVDLPSKMALVTSGVSAEVILKMDAQGQAVAASFNDGNVLLRDGTRDMQADLNMASHKLVNLAAGTATNDAATYGQLQSALAGLSWKEPVKEIAYDSASVVGPVSAGYRVLVSGGETAGDFAGHTNEIAVRNSTNDGWDFLAPAANWSLFNSALNQGWTYSSTDTVWVPFTGADSLATGDALAKVGNVLNVKYNDSTIGLNGSNQLEIKSASIGNGLIAAGAGIEESKLDLDWGTQALYDFINTHTAEATIHRSIDDSATTAVVLWSASKIHTEDEAYLAIVNSYLAGKSDVGHTHTSSDITDFSSAVSSTFNAAFSSAFETYAAGTSQVILAGGKDKKFVGEKINIAEGSAAAFCNVDVAANAYVTLKVTGTLFGSLGKAVANGEWMVVLRKISAGSVAVSSVQTIAGIDSVHENAAELKFTDLATVFTAAAVDTDTVALKINSALEGTDGITQYGIDYSIQTVGVGVAGFSAQ